MDDRLDGVTVAHDQGADPLRGADLVTGDGDEGAADVRERYGDLAQRLDGVRMETDARHAERPAAVARRERGPDDRQVVRLRAARGEDHLAGLDPSPQRRSDRALRLLDA